MRRYIHIALMLITANSVNAQHVIPVMQATHGRQHTFGAVPYGKGWVMVTDAPELTWASHVNQQGRPLYRLVATDSAFKHLQALPGIMHEHVNYGPMALYAGAEKAVVTRNMPASKARAKAPLGLFFYRKENGSWIEAQPFVYNSSQYSCGHAALNAAGDTMVFASDMPGGLGGTDLYLSVFNGAQWDQPRNIRAVNSAADDLFPFIDTRGRLYFSSGRAGGRGGLDIYASQTTFPYNHILPLDSAINSSYDDFAYTSNASGDKGSFASNRSGYDQVYTFTQWVPVFNNCIPWEETVLCYDFFEEATTDIKTLPLKYEWDFGDGYRVQKLAADHCFDKPGTYTIQLNVLDTVLNKLFMNEAMYELEITEAAQPAIDYALHGDSLIIDATQGTWNAFSAEEMYWQVGGLTARGTHYSGVINKNSLPVVYLLLASADKMQTQCFTRRLEVKAATVKPDHTLQQKNEAEAGVYRVVLDESETRVNIDPSHFSSLYPQVNEYYIPGDSVYKYTLGEARNPLALKPTYDKAHKAGFGEAHVESIPQNIAPTSTYQVSRTVLTQLDEQALDTMLGSNFELPLVYFDYNKTDIKPECQPPLDMLAAYLVKHPGYSLQVTAHTDDVGPDKFNLDLSARRAAAVARYLGGKGIARARIAEKGHGEASPKYPNTSPENQARNRRVEFRILK